MSSKTISLPEPVYEKLREERGAEESFGDVIDRLLGGRNLEEFSGIWSEETAAKAKRAVEEGRAGTEDRIAELVE